jgi:hypothetical protein
MLRVEGIGIEELLEVVVDELEEDELEVDEELTDEVDRAEDVCVV